MISQFGIKELIGIGVAMLDWQRTSSICDQPIKEMLMNIRLGFGKTIYYWVFLN